MGKGTVVRELHRRHPEVAVSVSATTREPRPGETDGVSYFFVSDARFDQLVADGLMLEWNAYGHHRYGTPRLPVERALAQGHDVILEIDVNGARQVRARVPAARLVFLAPPSWEDLERRLAERGTEDPGERRRRLHIARAEMDVRGEFDAVVINDRVERAAQELAELMGLE